MGWFGTWSSDEDDYEGYDDDGDDRMVGGKSDGDHNTVYREGSHRSWDSDDRGGSHNDHSTDHDSKEITQR